jgi:hypothetical protein
VWSLYGDIYTPVVRLMCGVCMETLVYTRSQTDVRILYEDICTPVVRLMCGVSMETSVHK